MDAVEKDTLLIMYDISIAQITSQGGIVGPGHHFNSKGVGTQSKACQAADNVITTSSL